MSDMDDEKMQQWQDELQRRREAKGQTHKDRARVADDREPGPTSCFTLSGGTTRHGNPCLHDGKPQFGGGCWQHPLKPSPDYVPPPEGATLRPPTAATGRKGGDRWAELEKMLEDQGVSLEEFVSKLDPEELARGQIRAVDGSFRGAPPKWVPRAFMQACVKELMRRGKELYQENYVTAIETMIALATSGDIEGSVRLRAAQFVIERIEGKTPDKIILETKDSFSARVEELEAAMDEDEQLQRVKQRLAGAEDAATAG